MGKIDYEITVDVSNANYEQKKRVQDAFFKLGIKWAYNSEYYENLGKAMYTNKHDTGEVLSYLMWCYTIRKPTHTIDQLLELAGMKTETNLVPFDLEKALAGDPVVTRDGREVTQITVFDVSDERYRQIACLVEGRLTTYHKNGVVDLDYDSQYDLFMKPKTHIVNGFEVPAPVTNPENMKSGITYYVADNTYLDWYFETTWENDEEDKAWITRNLVFMYKEDAITNAKAMSGVNPYGGCNE